MCAKKSVWTQDMFVYIKCICNFVQRSSIVQSYDIAFVEHTIDEHSALASAWWMPRLARHALFSCRCNTDCASSSACAHQLWNCYI